MTYFKTKKHHSSFYFFSLLFIMIYGLFFHARPSIAVQLDSYNSSGSIDAIGLVVRNTDTVMIESDRNITGTIFLVDEGTLIIDNANLIVEGHIIMKNKSRLIVRNRAWLRIKQFYMDQYYIVMQDSCVFEASHSKLDGNGTLLHYELTDYAKFFARYSSFPDWTFHRMTDKTVMDMAYVDKVGDFTVSDSCSVTISHSASLMPWLTFNKGSHASLTLPSYVGVDHFSFPDSSLDVSGIGYSLNIDSCRTILWSIINWTGSDVHIHNSTIFGSYQRMNANATDTQKIANIPDSAYFEDQKIPLTDRSVRYTKTRIIWLGWTPMNRTYFVGDSLGIFEMAAYHNSRALIRNSTFKGTHIGARDNGMVTIENSHLLTPVLTVHNATMVLKDCIVTPESKWKSTSIAKNNSKLFCSNSPFTTTIEALDNALILFASIDSIVQFSEGEMLFSGSAFLKTGPKQTSKFGGYKLQWRKQKTKVWYEIMQSNTSVNNRLLGNWALPSGIDTVEIKLTTWTDTRDSLSAYRFFCPTSIGNKEFSRSLLPKSCNSNALGPIRIYNLQGRCLHTGVTNSPHRNSIPYNIRNAIFSSGFYITEIQRRNEKRLQTQLQIEN